MKSYSEVFSIPITPIDHVNDKQKLNLSECSICHNIKLKSVRCKYSCHQTYCTQCAAERKMVSLGCTKCQTQHLRLQQIPGLNINFTCPYNPKKCKPIFKNQQEFKTHCLTCEYISQYYKLEFQHRKKYQCTLGHTLIFMTPDIRILLYRESQLQGQRLNKNQCSLCLQTGSCVTFCLECSKTKQQLVGFCFNCRQIPCTKSQCPLGHMLKCSKYPQSNFICDLCGILTTLISKDCYSDRQCDFDICTKCHAKLPMKNNLIPLQNAFSVYLLSNMHPMRIQNQLNMLQIQNSILPLKKQSDYIFLGNFVNKTSTTQQSINFAQKDDKPIRIQYKNQVQSYKRQNVYEKEQQPDYYPGDDYDDGQDYSQGGDYEQQNDYEQDYSAGGNEEDQSQQQESQQEIQERVKYVEKVTKPYHNSDDENQNDYRRYNHEQNEYNRNKYSNHYHQDDYQHQIDYMDFDLGNDHEDDYPDSDCYVMSNSD